MRILLLYPDLPSETKAAGHKSAFKTIETLYSLGHELHLVAFDSTGVQESDLNRLHDFCKSIFVVEINTKQKICNCLKNIFYPHLVSSRISSDFLYLVETLIPDIDIIHIEFSQLLYYVRYLKTKYPKKKMFFYAHDILEQRSYREAKHYCYLNPFKTLDYLVTKFTEPKLLSFADRVIVFNAKDSLLLKTNSIDPTVITLYTSDSIPIVSLRTRRADTVVFFGAMNRKENYKAVIQFINNCWPAIRTKHPNTKLLVVGANPHISLMKYQDVDGVHVTGFLDNPYKLISSSLVTVAPIRLGAGLKVKVLESLLCGCPVVAFPAGSEGIDLDRDEGLITVATNEEMVDEVNSIILGEVKYDPLYVRKCVLQKFNWEVSLNFWKEYYQ